MNTAEKFHSPNVPSQERLQTRHARRNWAKLTRVIRELLGLTPDGNAPGKKIAQTTQCELPIVGKVATISAAGLPPVIAKHVVHAASRPLILARAVTPANDRRPGLQNRWKSSDRVAIL